jgi:hypothetical protein
MTWLRKTHQLWKLVVLDAVICLGLVLFVFNLAGKRLSPLVATVTSVVAIIVFLVAFWSIRCPYCGAAVGWTLLTKSKVTELWTKMAGLEVCPVCSDDPNGPNRDPPPAPFSAWRS